MGNIYKNAAWVFVSCLTFALFLYYAHPANASTSLAITAPASGISVSGDVAITATGSSDVDWARICILPASATPTNCRLDGGDVIGRPLSPPYAVTWDTASVPNGTYIIEVDGFNGHTLEGVAFEEVTVANGVAANGVAITAPLNGATVSGTTTISATGSASVDWMRICTLPATSTPTNCLFDGGTVIGGPLSPPYAVAWNTATLLNGTYIIEADGYDAGTLEDVAHETVIVDNGGAMPYPTATSTQQSTAATPTPSPRPTPNPVSSPTPGPVSPPAYFSTLPPNAAVPGRAGEATCAAEIPVTAETIASNAQSWNCAGQSCPPANWTLPDSTSLDELDNDTFFETEAGDSGQEDAIPYMQQVDGSYATVEPSTDMIIRWASCKWGLDENSMRAEAVVESGWHQTDDFGDGSSSECTAGDGVSLIGLKGASPSADKCWRSWGILQIMVVVPNYNAWDSAWKSTPFNADYRAAFQRACMDGKIAGYMQGQGSSEYAAYTNPTNAANTDYMFWGCMGEWYSGDWYDSGAQSYISQVQQALSARAWIGLQ
jgi:hypothetical protein